MIVVIGSLLIERGHRDHVIELSSPAVAAARAQGECLHFSVSPDSLDADRVNIGEVWATVESLDAFRHEGPSSSMNDLIVGAEVTQYVTT